MKKRRDSGLEGYRKGGIQERRVQDRRDAEQERCWTGRMQERWDAGQVDAGLRDVRLGDARPWDAGKKG